MEKRRLRNVIRCLAHPSAALAVGGALLILAGCGGSPPPADLDKLTIVDEDVVTFGPADTTYLDPSYRLGPGDEIALNFLFDRTLNTTIIVRPDGGINLPIIGDVVVAGETPGHLCEQISAAYGRYYTNPQLSINLTQYAPAQCYVLGQVRYPKAVTIRPGMTVLGALAEAGGGDAGANLGSAVLIRRVAENRAVARRLNLSAFAKGKTMRSDLYLQDYDILYVPTTFMAKLTSAIHQVFSNLTEVPVFYLRGWEMFHTDLVYNRQIRPSEVTTTTETP